MFLNIGFYNSYLGLSRCSRSNIGQCPSSFKLKGSTDSRNIISFTQRKKKNSEIRYLSWRSRHLTKTGRTPLFIKASIGGFRSDDNSFLAACTAANWMLGSGLEALATICSSPASDSPRSASSSSMRCDCDLYFEIYVLICVRLPVESVLGTFRFLRRVSSRLFFRNSTVTSFLLLLISCRHLKRFKLT